MKTMMNLEQDNLSKKVRLFRQLFELQIELEASMEREKEYSQELKAIADSIDGLFERILKSEKN
ncbi:MAG: hypothetical protein P8P74_10175 [Crocinitomicaceae bacterium]|nr:hypothetical protein [Crocinitomicaceae bacterium]